MKYIDLLEVLGTLRQFENIMEKKLDLVLSEEIAQRILNGIRQTKGIVEKEMKKNIPLQCKRCKYYQD